MNVLMTSLSSSEHKLSCTVQLKEDNTEQNSSPMSCSTYHMCLYRFSHAIHNFEELRTSTKMCSTDNGR